MSKSNLLKKLAAQLSDALPKQVQEFKKDFEKSCHLILTKTFNRFDLVTRDEFDTQSKVLLRTRKKLEDLEKQLKELENLIATKRKSDD